MDIAGDLCRHICQWISGFIVNHTSSKPGMLLKMWQLVAKMGSTCNLMPVERRLLLFIYFEPNHNETSNDDQ
jgi:hypothetical protein